MPVITEQEARRTAEAVLQDMSSVPGMPPLAIMNVEERQACWVVYYQSVRYIETGSFLDSSLQRSPYLAGPDGSAGRGADARAPGRGSG